jgi:predicted nucleotide-binding protein (sugar kinase/HSP70/actin superfamily)
MEHIAEIFGRVELDEHVRRPAVGLVGEIYVRNHPFANSRIISRLEELGAACELASVAEWIYYTNFTRARAAVRRRDIWGWLENAVQDFFQHRIEKLLAVPLEKKHGPLAEHPIRHVIELAEPYVHDSFEGEAILSVGKIVEFSRRGFGGVVNVMPFSCMPSTIVESQSMRLSRDCGGMPILNLSFDGQADATLATRLEAFVEQVRHRAAVSVGSLAGL